MNSKDLNNLQEAYMDVYDNNLNEESKLGYLGKQKRKYNNEKNASDKYTGVKMPSDVNHTTNQVKAAFRAHRKNENLSGNDLHKIASASESFDLYDIILSHLLDEGYADTQEAAESIMVNMSEDWRESIFEEKKPLPVDRMAKQAEHKAFQNNFDVGGSYHYYNTNKKLKKMSEIGGEKVEKAISRGRINATKFKNRLKEQVDLYDLILSHLLDEGYADTQEAAESIMVNMSEDWRESIVEGHKPLPEKRMAKQARRIAFSHGTDVNSDEGSSGNVPHSNAAGALATMARIGGKKVKSHIKKGYEQGSKYDPYYHELNSRNPSRNKEV